MTTTKLFLIKALWGVEEIDQDKSKWPALFQRIKSEGFDAVETHGVYFTQKAFVEEYLLKALEIEKELQIPIVHETHRRRIFWNPFQLRDKGSKGFRYMTSRSVQVHVESLKTIGLLAKQAGAKMINAHSGVDSWSNKQVCNCFVS